jgi:hypothetical protein
MCEPRLTYPGHTPTETSAARRKGTEIRTAATCKANETTFKAVSAEDHAALQQRVTTLEGKVGALETRLAGVTRPNAGTLLFTGMNLQVVNGSGHTYENNGLGNIIVGYNGDEGDTRTGSHNVVIGDEHTWTTNSGFVSGWNNTLLLISSETWRSRRISARLLRAPWLTGTGCFALASRPLVSRFNSPVRPSRSHFWKARMAFLGRRPEAAVVVSSEQVAQLDQAELELLHPCVRCRQLLPRAAGERARSASGGSGN